MTLDTSPREAPLELASPRCERRRSLGCVDLSLISDALPSDPSRVATYIQAGSQFGLDMLWTTPFTWPLVAVVREMCVRIQGVTGKGLSTNIHDFYPPIVVRSVVVLLLGANIFNIAADVSAMGEVAELSSGFDRHLMATLIFVLILVLRHLARFTRYVARFRWLALALVVYALVLFTVHVPWRLVLMRSVVPHVRVDASTAQMVTAIFGAVISPYLFFWQASHERQNADGARSSPSNLRSSETTTKMLRFKHRTWLSLFVSHSVAFSIILAAAVTLHVAGITTIETAVEAASTLEPLAGPFAFLPFALGILGVGLIGVIALAGSAASALSDALASRHRLIAGEDGFYGIVGASMLAGLGLQYVQISPMRALYWAAVINGIVALPLTAIVVLLASKPEVMGSFVSRSGARVIGWFTIAFMAVAVVATALLR